MSNWHFTIKLGDVWRNEDMTFEQRRNAIALRLRDSRWFRTASPSMSLDLLSVIEDIENAADTAEFDDAWDSLYDLADYDRAWIDTLSPAGAR